MTAANLIHYEWDQWNTWVTTSTFDLIRKSHSSLRSLTGSTLWFWHLITLISWSSLATIITCALTGDKHPRHQMTFSDFTVFNWILWIKQFVISVLGVFVTPGEDRVIWFEWEEHCSVDTFSSLGKTDISIHKCIHREQTEYKWNGPYNKTEDL